MAGGEVGEPAGGRAASLLRRLALLSSLLLTTTVPLPAQEEPFGEAIQVREGELVVELPGVRPRAGAVEAEELLVLIDGAPREATVASPLAAEEQPWKVLLYVDPVLAAPETIARGALALSRAARRLVRLGAVEIVVADPLPHTLLAPETHREPVENVLAAVAHRARAEEGFAATPASGLAPGRLDPLLLRAAEEGAGRPTLLVLVVDGPSVSALDVDRIGDLLRGEVTPSDLDGALGTLARTARTLAAYGWVVAPVFLADERLEARPGEPDDFEVWEERHDPMPDAGGGMIDLLGLARWLLNRRSGRRGEPSTDNDPRSLDRFLDPRLAPLQLLARDGAGAVVRHEADLAELLERLERRWRIGYRALAGDDSPLVAPVEVRRTGGRWPLPGPRWVCRGTPVAVSDARLRSLLTGLLEPGEGELVVAVSPVAGGSPGRVEVRLVEPPEAAEERVASTELRLSWAWRPPSGGVRILGHETIGAEGSRLTLPAGAIDGVGRLALLVDEPHGGRWGASLWIPPGAPVPAEGSDGGPETSGRSVP